MIALNDLIIQTKEFLEKKMIQLFLEQFLMSRSGKHMIIDSGGVHKK